MKLCGFQGNQFSQVFEPLVYKGGSRNGYHNYYFQKKDKFTALKR